MNHEDRRYIQKQARFESKILNLVEGDYVEVATQEADFRGTVKDIYEGALGENNHAVQIEPDEPLWDAIHAVVIDYEGALDSNFEYYVPYIVGVCGDSALGDVTDISVNYRPEDQ